MVELVSKEYLTSRGYGVEPLDGHPLVTLIGDCVASIHGLSQVPGQLHRDGAGHARSNEIANRPFDGNRAESVLDSRPPRVLSATGGCSPTR